MEHFIPAINPNRVARALWMQPEGTPDVPDFIRRSAMTAVLLRALILSQSPQKNTPLGAYAENILTIFTVHREVWERSIETDLYNLYSPDMYIPSQICKYFIALTDQVYWERWHDSLRDMDLLPTQLRGLAIPLCNMLDTNIRLLRLSTVEPSFKSLLRNSLANNQFKGVARIDHEQEEPFKL